MLSDADLLVRLQNFEDPFTERKTASDVGDVLKTAVGFANSLPLDAPGVIFIPAKDDGTIQEKVNLDELQKNITRRLSSAYPALPTTYKIVSKEGRQVIAIVVFGSKNRPHFSGPAFVRKGSQTFNASEEEFARLIAERSSKVHELLKWVGKTVRVKYLPRRNNVVALPSFHYAKLKDCNEFYVVFTFEEKHDHAAPLSGVDISFDPPNNCLMLEIAPG